MSSLLLAAVAPAVTVVRVSYLGQGCALRWFSVDCLSGLHTHTGPHLSCPHFQS